MALCIISVRSIRNSAAALTNPAECEQIRSHNSECPRLAFVMRIAVRGLGCRKKCQAKMNQCYENGGEGNLHPVNSSCISKTWILTKPAR